MGKNLESSMNNESRKFHSKLLLQHTYTVLDVRSENFKLLFIDLLVLLLHWCLYCFQTCLGDHWYVQVILIVVCQWCGSFLTVNISGLIVLTTQNGVHRTSLQNQKVEGYCVVVKSDNLFKNWTPTKTSSSTISYL